MALFKPFKGSRASLDAQPLHDGYAYFCIDDGSFHIDYADSDGNLHRKQISGQYADALTGHSISTILNSSDAEIPTSKAILDAIEDVKAEVLNNNVVVLVEAQKAALNNDIVVLAEAQKSIDAVSNLIGETPVSEQIDEAIAAIEIPEGFSGSWNDLTDKPFGESIESVEIIPETTIAATASEPAQIETTAVLEIGNIYIINWNGVEYTCVAQDYAGFIQYLGNLSALSPSVENTGEPFLVVSGEGALAIVSIDGTVEQTISIVAPTTIVHQLEKKYMPEHEHPLIEHEHSYTHYQAVHAAMPGVGDQWESVTYGNGKFVAVPGGSNYRSKRAAYSEDGITWVYTSLPAQVSWMSVTYGNNKFVAVSEDYVSSDVAAYSEDGITWTQTALPVSAKWRSVTYGNNKFVAVSYNSDIAAYSEDGITWTQTALPVSAEWFSVTYGNNKFVAVSYDNSDIAAYSEDGITWTQTALPVSAKWRSVTYGNNKFVAVSAAYTGTVTSAYSTDGINWNLGDISNSLGCYLSYGNGKFITAYTDCPISYSEDGITWYESALPVDANWRAPVYGDGKFILMSYNTNIVLYSKDAIHWYDTYEEVLQDGSLVPLATETYVDTKISVIKYYVDNKTADFTKPLDEKYIPTTIARISDIPTVPTTEEIVNEVLERIPETDALTIDQESLYSMLEEVLV